MNTIMHLFKVAWNFAHVAYDYSVLDLKRPEIMLIIVNCLWISLSRCAERSDTSA
jgi:hypothetical protein